MGWSKEVILIILKDPGLHDPRSETLDVALIIKLFFFKTAHNKPLNSLRPSDIYMCQ